MSERLLKCEVLKGMFSHESVVKIQTASGSYESYFVPSSSIVDGRVRVQVLRQPGGSLAILPTEYRDAVTIRDEDLQPA